METLDFKTAFKYPFNRAIGLWNILWVFLPIFGWLALLGFQVRLTREWVQGKYKQLPKFSFKNDMKLGWNIFIRLLPLIIIVMFLGMFFSSWLEGLYVLLVIFTVPVLAINVMIKGKVDAGFDFKILMSVWKNPGDYLLMLALSLVLGLVFAVMSLVLVGIPAGTFTKNIFLADFYKRRVK